MRAAYADVTVNDVLEHFSLSMSSNQSVHMYVEYFDTQFRLEEFHAMIRSRLPDWSNALRNGRQYLWLGDGNTVKADVVTR